MTTMKQIIKWIDHNRFTVIGPIVGLLIFVFAVGCEPEVISPLTGQVVDAEQLAFDAETWAAEVEQVNKSFEFASEQLQEQQEQMDSLRDFILQLASGNVTSWPGLLQLVLGGSWLGLLADNARKSGVIGGLKKK